MLSISIFKWTTTNIKCLCYHTSSSLDVPSITCSKGSSLSILLSPRIASVFFSEERSFGFQCLVLVCWCDCNKIYNIQRQANSCLRSPNHEITPQETHQRCCLDIRLKIQNCTWWLCQTKNLSPRTFNSSSYLQMRFVNK